jgi:hypothetical protein
LFHVFGDLLCAELNLYSFASILVTAKGSIQISEAAMLR